MHRDPGGLTPPGFKRDRHGVLAPRRHTVRTLWLAVGLVVLGTLGPLLVREYLKQHPTNCRIVGDHEFVDGHCTPYCPPNPSECG